jgi:nucleosome binding factor SPN SPT16 subunit
MAEIKIDSKAFQERVSHFATAWKNDLRSKDGQFGGATSIIVMMGKVEEVPEFHKNNAMHVSHQQIKVRVLNRLNTNYLDLL